MAKNLVYLGVIVLAVIAVVLGYKIYQQQTALKTPPTTQQSNIRTTPKASPQPQAQPQAQQPSAAEVAEVLKSLGPNATEAERKKHQDLINKLGSSSDTTSLDVSGCIPNPVVYSVRKGGTFKVKNSDQIDHTIYTTIRTTIKANSEQTLTSKDIGDNFGDYTYGCDGSTGGAGIIRIVP